ncbi:hypothetical protein KTF21_11915 [Burkholderia multivorans]|uniref:hypothetical protein n=1 Tax=Burkholderia multivorans TaxID=87883 RepID=UPI001C231269|nr:hypothetical protein [Burkholderia multivorans]MBU9649387.1 hypothetical protein [Burkholderia multivorans]
MQPEFDPRFTVTLAALRKAGACYDSYNKLVRSLQGQPFTEEDEDRNSYIHFKHDAEIPLLDILKSNGLDDALWMLRCVSGADRDLRLFAVWCARQVEHLMEDQRSKDVLDVAERFANGEATEEERAAAWAAAWDAARAAAWAAARDAARAAQAEMFKRMCLGTAPWQQGKVAA